MIHTAKLENLNTDPGAMDFRSLTEASLITITMQSVWMLNFQESRGLFANR